jgi:hypothetical protein
MKSTEEHGVGPAGCGVYPLRPRTVEHCGPGAADALEALEALENRQSRAARAAALVGGLDQASP